jgi:hypothetical protein
MAGGHDQQMIELKLRQSRLCQRVVRQMRWVKRATKHTHTMFL